MDKGIRDVIWRSYADPLKMAIPRLNLGLKNITRMITELPILFNRATEISSSQWHLTQYRLGRNSTKVTSKEIYQKSSRGAGN